MLEKLINCKPKILVIGDLMIDHYLWGSSSRISPEAPVQIVDIKNESRVLGGAGNVVNNLKSLGASVDIISVVGNCSISEELKMMFADINVHTHFLIEQKNRITSKKTRIISSKQQVVRFDIESTDEINRDSETILYETFERIIEGYDLVIISDYGKGIFTEPLTKKIISLSNSKNIKVLVDPKGTNYSKYKNAHLLTPNIKEASEATGINISDSDSLYTALTLLKKMCSLDLSLITMSEEGIAILDNEIKIHPTVAREVFDVTGAGDTVIASIGFALASKFGINDSVKFANLAAGVVVSKVGSATTNIEEIIDYESSLHLSGCEEHIKSQKQISVLVKQLRNQNKKIVFTNGCFDILHVGHVKYLQKAKKLGDVLIVGINSDNSVRKLKGSSRPINPLEDRSCILAALECVDFVIPFEDETPIELIKKIMPNILAKGADYLGKEIAGQELVDELVFIDFIEGKSTSETIERIGGK